MNIRLIDNEADTLTDLFIDGKFVAGWNAVALSIRDRHIIEAMMSKVWDEAVRSKEKPLREAINRALSSY